MSPVRPLMAAVEMGGAIAAAAGGIGTSIWVAVTDAHAVDSTVLLGVVLSAFALVGLVVAAARPANPVGWLMLVGAASSSLGSGGAGLAYHGIVAAPGSIAGASAYALLGQCLRSAGWYVLTLGVPAVFPDGRLPGRRWRWLRVLLPLVLLGAVVGPLTDKQGDLTDLGGWQNPIALTGVWQVVNGAAFLTQILGGIIVAAGIVALLVVRWRGGGGLLRQQIGLFVAACALLVLAIPLIFVVGFANGAWVFGFTALPLPFAIGFAVLARGLYDLRTATNRTLVWVTLSAVVAGIYALAIAGLGNRLGVRGATWLPWLAAGVVAVSFAPLRDTLQRGINRLTFGRWEEPYDVLAHLGQNLEATANVHGLLERVLDELRALGLSDVALVDARGRVLAGGEPGAPGRRELRLTAFGQPVGVLAYLPPATDLRTRDRQLLADLAGHLGGVLHAHDLSLEAQRSRERLVLAREEERRRLRRDLHDGLGPSLAAHLLRLDLISAKLDPQTPVNRDIDALRDDLRATMRDVRNVVEGLRPPALDELGLAGALDQLAARIAGGGSTDVRMDIGQLPPMPAAVEVAAFRIIAEALSNAMRHASASICLVRVTTDDDRLRLEVRDNGCGLPDDRPRGGHGLQTMRERAEELLGRFAIRNQAGTVVSAEIPLPSISSNVPLADYPPAAS